MESEASANQSNHPRCCGYGCGKRRRRNRAKITAVKADALKTMPKMAESGRNTHVNGDERGIAQDGGRSGE